MLKFANKDLVPNVTVDVFRVNTLFHSCVKTLFYPSVFTFHADCKLIQNENFLHFREIFELDFQELSRMCVRPEIGKEIYRGNGYRHWSILQNHTYLCEKQCVHLRVFSIHICYLIFTIVDKYNHF